MKTTKNSNPPPIDIVVEILSRSSAKSVGTFGLASKFCASILIRPDLRDLFLTRSSTRPRLLFAVGYYREWCFFSPPQLQNPDEKPSLVVEADLLTEFRGDMYPKICGPVSGLLLFPSMGISKKDLNHIVPVICNPSTGQYARLPQLERQEYTRSLLLGYDPIEKQYKVLTTSSSLCRFLSEEKLIMTLGTGEVSWRKIKLPIHYSIGHEGICIDGVLYYFAANKKGVEMIACFNVRYEKLSFLKAEPITSHVSLCSSTIKLINYKGKLGVISWGWYYADPRSALRLSLWILEDTQTQEWLQHVYVFWVNSFVEDEDEDDDLSLAGVAANGEFIFSMDYTDKHFFVFYFNPERNTFEKVEIQGFEKSSVKRASVYTFVDYTEDLKFIR